MAARPIWRGQIRLALVSIPVELFPATRSGAQIQFHQVHEPTGKRIKYEKVVPGIGPVDRDEIVKGYEVSKGHYVLLDPEEIESVKLESRKTLDLVQSSGVASRDVDTLFRRILLSADKGDWADTWTQVDLAKRASAKVSADVQRRFTLVDTSLRVAVDPGSMEAKALRERLRPTIDWLQKASGEYRADGQLDALLAAYLAARGGDLDLARDALAAARPQDDYYPVLTDMFTIADAERQRAEGKADGGEGGIAEVALEPVAAWR